MKKTVIGLLLALPLGAAAQDFSYDYIGGAYAHTEGDRGLDADAGALELGWEPGKYVYTKLGVGYASVDNSSVDTWGTSLTVGGHAPLADAVDMYMGVTGAWTRSTDVPFSDDLDGYGLGAEIGLRTQLGPQFELDVSGSYLDLFAGDLDDSGADTSDFTGALTLRFYPTERFSIDAGYAYAFDAETDTYSLGARFNF